MSIEKLLAEKRKHNLPLTVNDEERAKLAKQMPIQKILGFINFDDLVIKVDKAVLIPRFETEEVLHFALPFINKNSKVLDLCCGSGYLGLSIKQKTNAQVTLSDIDIEAIKQTKINAKINNLKVQIIQSDLFTNIKGQFDLIIANPPYLVNQMTLAKSVVQYEPHHALFGGLDGNDFYRKILAKINKHLKPQGIVIFELGPDNASFLKAQNFKILNDLNGKARIAFKQFA